MAAVILASGSPARRALLQQTGITAHVIVPGVDEDQVVAAMQPGSVADQTRVLAQAKAQEVLGRITSGQEHGLPDSAELIVVAADSLLELDNRPVGKPGTAENVKKVWSRLGGATSTLYTGHCVSLVHATAHGFDIVGTSTEVAGTQVTTMSPTAAELDDYIATGEPLHVAGALTIDGFGSAFVSGLQGDHTNVIGLSLPLLRSMVTRLGVHWPKLWDRNR